MRFFFKSRKFKIAATVVSVLLVLSILAHIAGGILSPQSDLLGALVAPFQKIATNISNSVTDLFQKFESNEQLILQNAALQSEINKLNEKIADYDILKNENDFYKNYLEIKSINPDFKFSNAVIISRDTTDSFGGFTINCGSLSGIEQYDPVITEAGLVGYISQVGLTSSKVTTILSPNISVGVTDSRTGDAGIVTGSVDVIAQGHTKMNNLQRASVVAVGDYIVTAGGGVFPSGILVGKITNIAKEQYSSALYAELEPFVKITEIRQVMVITDFAGKNIINMPSGE